MKAYSTREAASSCRSWPPGVDAAQAITMSAITSSALAGSTTFTARPLHCDKIAWGVAYRPENARRGR